MKKLNYLLTQDLRLTTYIPSNSDTRFAAQLAPNQKATLKIPNKARLFYVSAQQTVHVGFSDFTPIATAQFTPVHYISDQAGIAIPDSATDIIICNSDIAQHVGLYFYG